MKVLIACEFSGIVRDAFIAKGHDAVSCDLLPTEATGPHIQGDVLAVLNDGWDLMIAHPECKYLAVCGNRWMKNNPERQTKRTKAIEFFETLYFSSIPEICIENPVGIMSTQLRRPDQYIQPYEFGHPETKKTGLWLKGLSKLQPTNIVEPQYIIGKDGNRYSPIHYLTQWSAQKHFGMARDLVRSLTYTGIAKAMAEQWSYE